MKIRKTTIILALLALMLACFHWKYEFSLTSGRSMEPTYPNHTLLLISRVNGEQAIKSLDIRAGNVVQAIDPDGIRVCKRVLWIKDNQVFLQGDGTISHDSWNYGPIPYSSVKGKVILKIM